MVTHQDIIDLLVAQLSAAALLYGAAQAPYAVVAYSSPDRLLKYYLLNGRVQVLFTVKRAIGMASRVLQKVARRNQVDFEVGVWCACKHPELEAAFQVLRDSAILEVQRIFRAYPAYGTEKALKDDDHAKGDIWVLNSILTVTVTSVT